MRIARIEAIRRFPKAVKVSAEDGTNINDLWYKRGLWAQKNGAGPETGPESLGEFAFRRAGLGGSDIDQELVDSRAQVF